MNSPFCSRRHFLRASSFSLGSLALTWLLNEDSLPAGPVLNVDEAMFG